MYKENPKVKGSGIICCIPQGGTCPNRCEDCFFQSGRSYLEPLDQNVPNIPNTEDTIDRVVRVNDGNDSNVKREIVETVSGRFHFYFFNTAIPKDLEKYSGPVVLTVNPGGMTDVHYHRLEQIPQNLMFVRVRTNTWNIGTVVAPAIEYYSSKNVPVVLTFMAYFGKTIPEKEQEHYIFRKRTLNEYWAITTAAWRKVMSQFQDNKLVYSCGKIEGELGTSACARCGNCIREYFVTRERCRAKEER
jgi:hypothetical protein